MKQRTFLAILLLLFAAEILTLAIFALSDTETLQDSVAVNEAVHSVQDNWDRLAQHKNAAGLSYVVLDLDGNVRYRTKDGLSETKNQAIIHRDTILELETGGNAVGWILIANDSIPAMQAQKRHTALFLAIAACLQGCICAGYLLYIHHTMIRPFSQLKGFAERIADGNLDIPLEMDRRNLFGAFTEAFDLMRSELKKARIAQAKANADKKELVAKLSHDIKTPVASIKAACEVGAVLAETQKSRDNYVQIIRKADQIHTLITNLFTAALEELSQLTVTPGCMEGKELEVLLLNADYLHRTAVPAVPDCLLYADRLRLQQVFDNLFANSYKYADTRIDLTVCQDGGCLAVTLEDYGGGISPAELPLLKEKFKRGTNIKDIEGSGLGLYISDYFMKEMHGKLIVENGDNGLKVTVMIALGGGI